MNEVLFINGHTDYQWIEALGHVAIDLGYTLKLIDHMDISEIPPDLELIIVDAGAIDNMDLVPLVQQIRLTEPESRIVVISSAPHWKEATQTLLAGATDYVRKSDDRKAILDLFKGSKPALIKIE